MLVYPTRLAHLQFPGPSQQTLYTEPFGSTTLFRGNNTPSNTQRETTPTTPYISLFLTMITMSVHGVSYLLIQRETGLVHEPRFAILLAMGYHGQHTTIPKAAHVFPTIPIRFHTHKYVPLVPSPFHLHGHKHTTSNTCYSNKPHPLKIRRTYEFSSK